MNEWAPPDSTNRTVAVWYRYRYRYHSCCCLTVTKPLSGCSPRVLLQLQQALRTTLSQEWKIEANGFACAIATTSLRFKLSRTKSSVTLSLRPLASVELIKRKPHQSITQVVYGRQYSEPLYSCYSFPWDSVSLAAKAWNLKTTQPPRCAKKRTSKLRGVCKISKLLPRLRWTSVSVGNQLRQEISPVWTSLRSKLPLL